jgi:SAM-dependent methyltransferase
MTRKSNLDPRTVEGFGVEWTRFDQSALGEDELRGLFHRYFKIFDWSTLPADAEGFDAGCGSGRWALGVAPRVGTLHCVDASERALDAARRNLQRFSNCQLYHAAIDNMPFPDNSMDFGYSLGVLHHLPDPITGLRACVSKLKPQAPFLLYMYYAFDNRPIWYRAIWRITDITRRVVAKSPAMLRVGVAEVVASLFYWPLARTARWCERRGWDVSNFPLSFYRHQSFYTMRTDALDRLGTPIEHRFSRIQIGEMMTAAGLTRVEFNDDAPYWCALGYRR